MLIVFAAIKSYIYKAFDGLGSKARRQLKYFSCLANFPRPSSFVSFTYSLKREIINCWLLAHSSSVIRFSETKPIHGNIATLSPIIEVRDLKTWPEGSPSFLIYTRIIAVMIYSSCSSTSNDLSNSS